MIFLFFFISIISLFILGITISDRTKKRYLFEINEYINNNKLTFIKLEEIDSSLFEEIKDNFFVNNFGSTPFFVMVKKVTYKDESNQSSFFYVKIEYFFFYLKKLEFLDSNKTKFDTFSGEG